MHDRESFQEQAREREWRVTQGWSVGSGKKKKQETVAKVFKNRRDIENRLLPSVGQSDRQK